MNSIFFPKLNPKTQDILRHRTICCVLPVKWYHCNFMYIRYKKNQNKKTPKNKKLLKLSQLMCWKKTHHFPHLMYVDKIMENYNHILWGSGLEFVFCTPCLLYKATRWAVLWTWQQKTTRLSAIETHNFSEIVVAKYTALDFAALHHQRWCFHVREIFSSRR